MTQHEQNAQAELRWRTDDLFAGLDAPDFAAAWDGVAGQLTELEALFDRHAIRAERSDDAGAVFEEVAAALNALLERLGLLGAFVNAFVSTDSRNAAAQARAGELARLQTRVAKLSTRFDAWVGAQDAAALNGELAGSHAQAIRRARVRAAHQMSAPEEELASELAVYGPSAFGRLHANLTSQLSAEFQGKRLPMTALRNLASDPDPSVREGALQTELQTWAAHELPLAACMNGVKGSAAVLASRRGWEDVLATSLLANALDRETLAAMQTAVTESFPAFRRYLRAKARLLGHDSGLPWHDLTAPLPGGREWPYAEAQRFVREGFAAYSPALGQLADDAFGGGWIDVHPRGGKRGGAFCMRWEAGKSRILLNYAPDLDAVSTLAHELGHAYHNTRLAGRTPLQKQQPMTLAETASIFCETLLVGAAMEAAQGAERLSILDTVLTGQTQVVVDIHSRFLFESEVLSRVQDRELSADELSEAMVRAQGATYGEGLSSFHPYMWAVKPHYYGSHFYNYPYTFGLLFGLGLYAEYRRAPEGFHERYDALLSDTGMEEAAPLAERFGIDIRTPDFWRRSLGVITDQIDEFERLARELN